MAGGGFSRVAVQRRSLVTWTTDNVSASLEGGPAKPADPPRIRTPTPVQLDERPTHPSEADAARTLPAIVESSDDAILPKDLGWHRGDFAAADCYVDASIARLPAARAASATKRSSAAQSVNS